VAEPSWTVVVPVKRLGAAKSRLRGALAGVPHERLALALALDTVEAALRCPNVGEVLAVTDDPAARRALAELGARPVPDPPGTGLNPALRRGATDAAYPMVAGLTADLPALRPAELAAALRAATSAGARHFVTDVPGTGTTLLAAGRGAALDPRFGPGSAGAHAASGAVALPDAWPGLRRDVDTVADLRAAAGIGLGRRTDALVGTGPGTVRGMQGTVATYDAETRSGTLLLDDGTEVAFPRAAFDASGLRLLRLGQRVRIEYNESGEVRRITLPTFL
jgi:2-phospho-L-lactate guanylyltransferase